MTVTIGNKKYKPKPINEYGVEGMKWGVKKEGSPSGRRVLARQVKKVRAFVSPKTATPQPSWLKVLPKTALSVGKERLTVAQQIRTLRNTGLVGRGAGGVRKLGQQLSGYKQKSTTKLWGLYSKEKQ